MLLGREGDVELWLATGPAAGALATRRSPALLRRILFSGSRTSAALWRLVVQRQLDGGVPPGDRVQCWARLRNALSSGELVVCVQPRPAIHLDPEVRGASPPAPPVFAISSPLPQIGDDEPTLLITRCDPQLGDAGPLTFSYMIRSLAGQPCTLRIIADGEAGQVVHERELGPDATQDGVHDDEWDGIVTSGGQLQGQRLPVEHGPCLLEVVHDEVYHDEASFDLAAVGSGLCELQLLDEHEQPLADVPVQLSGSQGSQTVVTDAEGLVQLEQAGGAATARIADLDALVAALAASSGAGVRSESPPEDPKVHLLGLGQADRSIELPPGQPQRLLVASWTEVRHSSALASWTELSIGEDGPWSLEQGQTVRLQLQADRSQRRASVLGPAAEPEPEPEPAFPLDVEEDDDGDGLWQPPNLYVVQAGDTLVAIAERYLGDGARWTEIWQLNQARYQGRSPDLIYPGDTFEMPPEAVPTWIDLPTSPPPGAVLEGPSAPPEPPQWLEVGGDELLGLLEGEDVGSLLQVLTSIPSGGPPPPPPPPPSNTDFEELLLRECLVELALGGVVDGPEVPAELDGVGEG